MLQEEKTIVEMGLLRLFTTCQLTVNDRQSLNKFVDSTRSIDKELCLYIETEDILTKEEANILRWLLASVNGKEFEDIGETSVFQTAISDCSIVEVGPRLAVCTPFCTNALSICASAGLNSVKRIEISRRYKIIFKNPPSDSLVSQVAAELHDRMTECQYHRPLESFDDCAEPELWDYVDIMTNGISELKKVNDKLGLAFDSFDLDMYFNLFHTKLCRNPTTVECFDLAQSNSEHSRHWFFKGNLVIDGEQLPKSLLQMVMDTQECSANNNVVKFSDNSSAIEGGQIKCLLASSGTGPSKMTVNHLKRHLVLTAETHNFPTGVEPFSGAATGVGGRIRDVQAIGRGGHVIAGVAGYCVGNLHIPDYPQEYESTTLKYPSKFARPLHVLLRASDGASDYGNKFGEPMVLGFCRSFGQDLPDGSRREWIKPIMFSGGLGTVDSNMVEKRTAQAGLRVVKLGGPAYRIGIGGGSASSVGVQGDNRGDLDFSAVQRGDPEMEQKLNRVVRACLERGDLNPILSIHDQGAGGNGNVIKELVDPAGAIIFAEEFEKGDKSLSVLELWGAEYQESNAVLCSENDSRLLREICERENCPLSFVGDVTGDGKIILTERKQGDTSKRRNPVCMHLDDILGKMPPKVFRDEYKKPMLKPLMLPRLSFDPSEQNQCRLLFKNVLEKVLSLPSVCCKRFLTNKVDRSVSGLVAQQQCIGPLHTPLADAAVVAASPYEKWGMASSVGEQPIKSLICPAAGARLSLAEALTNLAFVPISSLQDIKCSVNWMWPAKLPGEAAFMAEACSALCRLMSQLGVAADGGKDSLSMAARVDANIVQSPGNVVVSTYVKCLDITACVTPDLKSVQNKGRLMYVKFRSGMNRLGGSALAQSLGHLGDECPDIDNPKHLSAAFAVTQQLVTEGCILAGHDVSDGGLLVCALEMAIAGARGIKITISPAEPELIWAELMAEEPGWVLEVDSSMTAKVQKDYEQAGVICSEIGSVISEPRVIVSAKSLTLLDTSLEEVARMWERTSYQLEKLQTDPGCVDDEWSTIGKSSGPKYSVPPHYSIPFIDESLQSTGYRLAVIREEGTNGDREMAVAFSMAGFEVWDVTMSDLKARRITLDRFRGLAFPGGFSFADVFGSAVGWAASVYFDSSLLSQFEHYQHREDTFSLGVCNGCQLMAMLGWIPGPNQAGKVRLTRNKSGRFESRFSTVRLSNCSSPLLKDLVGSLLGVWVAHGEGRFKYLSPCRLSDLEENRQVAMYYTDDSGTPTELYPYNPNGSEGGVAALCSENGRHLAMMPHPERCILRWQWPYQSPEYQQQLLKQSANRQHHFSPWISLFTNAFQWCQNTAK